MVGSRFRLSSIRELSFSFAFRIVAFPSQPELTFSPLSFLDVLLLRPFLSYGRDQSCAMCLAVASESSSPSTPVSSDAISTATRWLYMLGEKPIKVERGYGHGESLFRPLHIGVHRRVD